MDGKYCQLRTETGKSFAFVSNLHLTELPIVILAVSTMLLQQLGKKSPSQLLSDLEPPLVSGLNNREPTEYTVLVSSVNFPVSVHRLTFPSSQLSRQMISSNSRPNMDSHQKRHSMFPRRHTRPTLKSQPAVRSWKHNGTILLHPTGRNIPRNMPNSQDGSQANFLRDGRSPYRCISLRMPLWLPGNSPRSFSLLLPLICPTLSVVPLI